MIDGVETPMRQMYAIPILGGFFYVYGARSAASLSCPASFLQGTKLVGQRQRTATQHESYLVYDLAVGSRKTTSRKVSQCSLSAEACHSASPTYAKTAGEHAPGYRLHIPPPCLALQVLVRLISSSLPVP
ncbi:MAG: hypothetical protein AAF400_02030 [Bacteroidota bacterium]